MSFHCQCLPWAYREALPVLYCVTFMLVCFLHPLQKARFVFGTFTCVKHNAKTHQSLLAARSLQHGATGARPLTIFAGLFSRKLALAPRKERGRERAQQRESESRRFFFRDGSLDLFCCRLQGCFG